MVQDSPTKSHRYVDTTPKRGLACVSLKELKAPFVDGQDVTPRTDMGGNAIEPANPTTLPLQNKQIDENTLGSRDVLANSQSTNLQR